MRQSSQDPIVVSTIPSSMNEQSVCCTPSIDFANASTSRNRHSSSLTLRRSASVDSCDDHAQALTAAVLRDMLDDSDFFHQQRNVPPLPSFTSSEIQIGNILGQGQFGEVLEVIHLESKTNCDCSKCHQIAERQQQTLSKKSNIKKTLRDLGFSSSYCRISDSGVDPAETDNETEITEHVDMLSDEDDSDAVVVTDKLAARMAHHVKRSDNTLRYAVKRVKPTVKLTLHDDAIVDLTCEAMFLSRLSNHANIVTLRATVGEPGTASFMLVMDKLTGNLHDKIQSWRKDWQKCRGKALGLWNRDKQGLDALYTERLLASFDIARALKHLHHHRILYRDIKPENIGVDYHGDMRLFDFGLAKELKHRDLVQPPDGYRATGVTGSRRYMAPEIVQSLPYGFRADTYSFGILLWEMLSLRTPFCGYDSEKHYEQVVVARHRPSLPRSWPLPVRTLLPRCWAPSSAERYTMEQVCNSLQTHLHTTCQANGKDDLHISTRSCYLSSRQTSM